MIRELLERKRTVPDEADAAPAHDLRQAITP